jgi:2-keto-4-pentenoate hydratase/2-oxohepta-3-ene-1,7-dioic acid hydratase in catechol pathway
MKICRFDNDRLGIIQGEDVLDVSTWLNGLPTLRWGQILADPVIARLPELLAALPGLLETAPRLALDNVRLAAPVAMPTKIIGAPVNYHAHIAEAEADAEINRGHQFHKIDAAGCFLKANSALTGHQSVIELPIEGERVDHEAEIAIVIGKPARKVLAKDAMAHVAGYCLALDMTVRGTQDRSKRKSCDGFAVLGPWLVTVDEIADHANIPFFLTVNGEERQNANTSMLIRSIPELIEMCSAFYTLNPGDVIMTGTPAGVSPVVSGDTVAVTSPQLGTLSITIA